MVKADAVAQGGNGAYARALASQTGTQLTLTAQTYSVSGTSDSRSSIGQPAPIQSAAVGKEAVAFGTALPQIADATAALAGNPNVHHDFDLGGNSQAWLLGNLGLLNTSTVSGFHDYHASLDLNLDTSSFTNQQHLLVGLLDPLFGSNNLGVNDTLTFSINLTRAGGNYANIYSFTDLNNAANPNSARSFFDDKTLDLSSWSSWVKNSNKSLDIVFGFNLHSQINGTGMIFGLIAGNSTLGSGPVSSVPLPSAAWAFLSGFFWAFWA